MLETLFNTLLTHSTWLWIAACILLSLMDTLGMVLLSRRQHRAGDGPQQPCQPTHC